jgi:hypothetical protein
LRPTPLAKRLPIRRRVTVLKLPRLCYDSPLRIPWEIPFALLRRRWNCEVFINGTEY